MPEVYTTPFVATTNAVISSSDCNAGYAGNIRYFRQYLSGNPSAGQRLVASGPDGATWTTLPEYVTRASPLATSFSPGAFGTDKGGMYLVGSPADAPLLGQSYYGIIVADFTSPTQFGLQIAIDNRFPERMYIREIISGTGTAWLKIWNSGNDGAGSGLDADTVQGVSLSSLNQVPSGLIGAFRTAAAIAAGWTRFTDGDGRLLVGAGTTFSVTYTQDTAYGSSWAHGHAISFNTGTSTTAGGTVQAGGSSSADPQNHVHPVSGSTADTTWTPVARAVVWAQKS